MRNMEWSDWERVILEGIPSCKTTVMEEGDEELIHCELRKPTVGEVDQVMELCVKFSDEKKTNFPSASFEEGVEAAIHWLRGNTTQPVSPMSEFTVSHRRLVSRVIPRVDNT